VVLRLELSDRSSDFIGDAGEGSVQVPVVPRVHPPGLGCAVGPGLIDVLDAGTTRVPLPSPGLDPTVLAAPHLLHPATGVGPEPRHNDRRFLAVLPPADEAEELAALGIEG